ncbi:hypothetical protein GCM10010495_76550 [Kitasatospora herbaricolor]|nr:hypothetical protein GCM10010495_76550 [Kitasatospora herbaricolor]
MDAASVSLPKSGLLGMEILSVWPLGAGMKKAPPGRGRAWGDGGSGRRCDFLSGRRRPWKGRAA